MSGAQRRGQPGWIVGRAPTGRTGPRGFHHRLFGRDASPAASGAGREPRADPGAEGTGGGVTRPPSLLARASGAGREPRADPGAEGTGGGVTRPPSLLARECRVTLPTGCWAGRQVPGRSAGRLFMRAASSLWWNPGERRERGGARLTRRVREEPPPGELARVYFDRNATQSAAKRRGSAGMHRRSSPHRENWAAWVSPQAARPISASRSSQRARTPRRSSRVRPWSCRGSA